jgi:ubiquinone/menaquinone biosynthesis C-methylase UbiE
MEPISENIQEGYNKAAAAYAQAFIDEQLKKPMDREMLARFARETAGKGTVCDMGCGPGQIAGYLYDHCGVKDILGVDLAPRFIEEAKKLHPEINFYQGNMLSLNFPDNSWAGITAFYCLIHIPHTQVVDALKELKRVLIPGGVLLLTFHIGSEIAHVDKFFDQDVNMDWVFFEVPEFEEYLKQAGYERISSIQREPYDPEIEHQSRRAYFFAYKPL